GGSSVSMMPASTGSPSVTTTYEQPPGPTSTPTATPTPRLATPTPTATRPTGGVTAEITECSAQRSNYACTLRMVFGAPASINTVLSVDISGGAFANPSGGARPPVTSDQGCGEAPPPAPDPARGG